MHSRATTPLVGYTRILSSLAADQQPFLWALSAAISLSSSKYLLVDVGLHCPLHLHLLHLGSLTLWSVLGFARQEACPPSSLVRSKPGFLLGVVLPGGMAVASGLVLQAILHFPNLATIAMLPIISHLADHGVAWLAKSIANPCHGPPYVILSLFICCVAVLYGEYRLNAVGLICAIPAALLTGICRSLYRNSEGYAHIAYKPSVDVFLFCLYGITTTGYLLWFMERGVLIGLEWDSKLVALMALNIASSTVAMRIGRSTMAPVLLGTGTDAPWTLLMLAGSTGCIATSLRQRSFTAISQLCFYTLAITVLVLSRAKPALLSPASSELVPSKKTSGAVSLLLARDLNPRRRSSVDMEDLGGPEALASSHVPRLLAAVPTTLTLVTWVLFITLNFRPWNRVELQQPLPSLDNLFNAKVPVDIVVSMYHEPLASVTALLASLQEVPALSGAQIHIYTKAAEANMTEIQQQTGALQVTQLPNVGRESASYLHHILTYWDSLARHTLFIQADVHNKRESVHRIQSYFNPQYTGMLSLGFVGHTVRCGGSDPWGWSDHSGVVSRVYEQVYHTPCERVLLSYKGQFIVSGQRIRGIAKSIYQELYETLVDGNSWAHQEPFLQGRADSLGAPVFGYTVERLWSTLFQCSDLDVAWMCPTLLSGEREGGSISDCQCLDR